jgi:hypothetical protein
LTADFIRSSFEAHLLAVHDEHPDMDRDEVFDLAEDRLFQALDAATPFQEPLESIVDFGLDVLVHRAIGSIDTPQERQAIWQRVLGAKAAVFAWASRRRAKRIRRQAAG